MKARKITSQGKIYKSLTGKPEDRIYLRVLDIEGFFFAVALRLNAGHSFLILEVSRSYTTTHHSR
jgi:hypothetical protein